MHRLKPTVEFHGGRGLAQHLDLLYHAVLEYLESKAPKETVDAQLNQKDVPIPGAYEVLLSMRRYNQMSYWSGGWANQPYVLYQELDACIQAEEQFTALQKANRRNEAKWRGPQTKMTS